MSETGARRPSPDPAGDAERAARDAFLRVHLADLQRGQPRTLAQYQALFRGFEAGIAEEWAHLQEGELPLLDTAIGFAHAHSVVMIPTRCPLCSSSVVAAADSLAQVVCPFCGTSVTTDAPAGADSARPTTDDPLIGKHLGGCRIDSVIGEGGMGSVYKAWQESLETWVAVKTIRRSHVDAPLAVLRFEREAKVTARFNSPYVIKIKDTGFAEGVHYQVMEYVDGEDLATYYKRQPGGVLSPAQALVFLANASSGLLEAEHLNIVHRDIKPANLLLTLKAGVPEVVRIADFGVLRDTTVDLLATNATAMTNPLVGTPMFMSPEQLRFDPVDHRSDMYSLGTSFFLMLTGVVPAAGATLEALRAARLAQKCLSPRRARPDLEIPKRLDAIIARMTALRPEDRYRSFQDVLDDIDKARTPGLSRTVRSVLLAAPLLFVGLLVVLWRSGERATAAPDPVALRADALRALAAKERPGAREAYAQARSAADALAQAITQQKDAQALPEVLAVRESVAALAARIETDLSWFTELDRVRTVIQEASGPLPDRQELDDLAAAPEAGEMQRKLEDCQKQWRTITDRLGVLAGFEQEVRERTGRYDELVQRLVKARIEADALELPGLARRFADIEATLVRESGVLSSEISACFAELENGPGADLGRRVEALDRNSPRLPLAEQARVETLRTDLGEMKRMVDAIGRLDHTPLVPPFTDLPARHAAILAATAVDGGRSEPLLRWAHAQAKQLVDELQVRVVATALRESQRAVEQGLADGRPASEDDRQARMLHVQRLLSGLKQIEAEKWPLTDDLLRRRRELIGIQNRIAAFVFVSLPANWPDWAKKAWPVDHQVPKDLAAAPDEDGVFFWPTASEREFVLVDGGGAVGPFLVERRLVSSRTAEQYFVRTNTDPGIKTWVTSNADPVLHLTVDEAEAIAADALPEVKLVLPTREMRTLAAGSVLEGGRSIRELLRSAASSEWFVNDQPLPARWSGASDVGFRCCYPLQRAK